MRTFWQLLSYYVNTKFVDKTPLFLNLDETSIPYTMLQLPGCVALPRHASLRMPVRKQDVRGALTYVSIICDAPHIQGKLPHYLFGTETKLTQKLLRGQRRLPQTALHIVRQKSAWTSCKNITKIVRESRQSLKTLSISTYLVAGCCVLTSRKGNHGVRSAQWCPAPVHTSRMYRQNPTVRYSRFPPIENTFEEEVPGTEGRFL